MSSDLDAQSRDQHHPELRIRHLRAVFVKNLTPFPARDALTSALASPQDQDTHSISDDLELTLAKRTASKSTSSVQTLFNHHLHEEKNISPENANHNTNSPTSASNDLQTLSADPHTENHFLPRRNPNISSIKSHVDSNVLMPISTSTMSTALWQVETREEQLTINDADRLVETFLTLSSAVGSRRSTDVSPPGSLSRHHHYPSMLIPPDTSGLNNGPGDVRSQPQPTLRPILNSQTNQKVHSNSENSHSTSSHVSGQFSIHKRHTRLSVPFFISKGQQPSTNPSFRDLDAFTDFADWVNLQSNSLCATLWGRSNKRMKSDHPKECQWNSQVQKSATSTLKEWTALLDWTIRLDELSPLSIDIESSSLPSNTLLFRFSHSKQLFCLPVQAVDCNGHDADLDLDVDEHASTLLTSDRHEQLSTAYKQRNGHPLKRKAGMRWQELIGLLAVQCSQVDAQHALEQVQELCDVSFNTNFTAARSLTISEKMEAVRQLHLNRRICSEINSQVETDVTAKRRTLATRRRNLAVLRGSHFDLMAMKDLDKEDLGQLLAQKDELEHNIHRKRSSLFASLAFIFQVDIISAADLTFGINGIPLPIPVSPDEPAPPLKLASISAFNEEDVSSALGCVAQAVQLIAAYSGHTLPYPITCIGSRSNIKDPISIITGPHKFPLYATGVEVYRFEYGVYLLNKNIEMLMLMRELESLDIRHTLPNLKNLLLTLSNDIPKETFVIDRSSDPRVSMGPIPAIVNGFTTPAKVAPSLSMINWKSIPFPGTWSILRSRGATPTEQLNARKPESNNVVVSASEGLVDTEHGTYEGQQL